jgi:hypothetical protein
VPMELLSAKLPTIWKKAVKAAGDVTNADPLGDGPKVSSARRLGFGCSHRGSVLLISLQSSAAGAGAGPRA